MSALFYHTHFSSDPGADPGLPPGGDGGGTIWPAPYIGIFGSEFTGNFNVLRKWVWCRKKDTVISLINLFSFSHDHLDRLRRNCHTFTLEIVKEDEESCGSGKQCPENLYGFFQAVLNELCLMSETTPEVNQRCVQLNLQLDKASLASEVSKLRYGILCFKFFSSFCKISMPH